MKTKPLFHLTGLIALVVSWQLLSFSASAAPAADVHAQFTTFPTPTPGADGRVIYIAQEGDSAWRIAAIFGIKVDDLYQLNNWEQDHVILPGDQIFLGLAGPAALSPTPGPSPTPRPLIPTATPQPGWGILCVLLYEDQNGDSMRQEEEPALAGGAISVSNRSGAISETADSALGLDDNACNRDPDTGLDVAAGFVMFSDLPEGDYNVSVAIPDGYNATKAMNRGVELTAGNKSYMAFGAQANAETVAEVQVIPETPRKSPLLGILGVLIVLAGVGLGIYAGLLRRTK